MRDSYREQLDDILADGGHMAQVVSAAVRTSTTALLEADLKLAEQVITDDYQLDAMQADIESRAFSLLARTAPVAGELRTLVATLRMVTELERMGDLAAHVAKIARLRYPESAVPSSLRPNFVRMADVAEKMVVTAGQTLNDRNIQTPRSCVTGMTRWTSCVAPSSGCCSATTGRTVSRPRSTLPCWVATTSGSPTTPPRWAAGSSTS